MNEPVTRSDLFKVAVNMVVGCVLVGLSAVVIDQWPQSTEPTVFGKLEFPITNTDRASAQAAEAVRDAVDAALAQGVDLVAVSPGETDTLLDALTDQGFLDATWHEEFEGTSLRIRRCVDRFGVVVESAVQPDAVDLEFWVSNGCGDDGDLVRGAFVVVTRQRVGS